jgi:FtsZ-binding cell division protein ZapB
MKGKQVDTSSSSSSSSEDEEEDEDDDDEESSDDDQSSSPTSDLDEEPIKLMNKVEKIIQRLNVKGPPIQIQDFIFTNKRNEQRKKGCYGCSELGHFMEVYPNKPTPKTKKKACKNKALTSIRSWDDSSSEEEDHHKRRRHKHSSSSTSCVCRMARGNKKPIPSDSDSDDELPSYDEIVEENLNFVTSQQKKLEKLKEKLDISQQAYATLLEQYETFANLNVELSTKIEQLEASANSNSYTINDEQLVKKNKKLKEKFARSQDAYKSLLAKMEKACLLKWKPCANIVMS